MTRVPNITFYQYNPISHLDTLGLAPTVCYYYTPGLCQAAVPAPINSTFSISSLGCIYICETMCMAQSECDVELLDTKSLL